jgi:hypothetical protein
MRGKSLLPMKAAGRSGNALVLRHARLSPNDFARCALRPRRHIGTCRVNFPLSTYSVFREKNVSQESEIISVTRHYAVCR